VRKGQRQFEGFEDKILALYARGLSTRDIERHLAQLYGVNVGRDLISRVYRRGHGRGPRVAAAAPYTAVDADAAQVALAAFDDKWSARFPVIT
jgi:transposase-like protein